MASFDVLMLSFQHLNFFSLLSLCESHLRMQYLNSLKLYSFANENSQTRYDVHVYFPSAFVTCRKNCEGLTVISPNEEVHGQDQFGLDGGIHVPGEYEASFSKTGLHRILSDPTGSESTPLYIITETRLKDLAHEARSNCDRCSQPLDVSIAASGSSAHITWVSCNIVEIIIGVGLRFNVLVHHFLYLLDCRIVKIIRRIKKKESSL